MSNHVRSLEEFIGRPLFIRHTRSLTLTELGVAYLASIRDTRCYGRYLDTVTTPLLVRAKLVLGESSRMIYSFAVTAGETPFVTGRAAVVLG